MSEPNDPNDQRFKGWTKPGPRIHSRSGENAPSPVGDEVGESTTVDAISGYYRIHQYKEGHRFSTDDVLVAWFASTYSPRVDSALDLGSGIGSVAMITAWRLPGAQFVTVEAQEKSIELARKSIEMNGLSPRFDARLGDFRKKDLIGGDEQFDLITGSPPYWPTTDGVLSENDQKVACRFEMRGGVEDYCEVAARHLAPGGHFFLIFPRVQEERVLDGSRKNGLSVLRSREVVLKEGDEPLLCLYQLGRREDFPEKFLARIGERGFAEPRLVIRKKDGHVSEEYSVIKLSIGFPP